MKKGAIWQVCFFLLVLVFWHYAVVLFAVPKYLFPGPLDVVSTLVNNNELIWKHAKITGFEVLAGLSLGIISGYLLSLIVVSFRACETVVYPYIIGVQTIPKIAIAPLLLIWFGYGVLPKIVVSALVCFFPIVISTVKGLKEIDSDLEDLVKTYQASKWQILVKIRIPNAVPGFFVGLKTAAPLSVVGAVVGEFVGSELGLGYLILYSQSNFNMSLAFAALLVLSAIGIAVFGLVVFVETLFFKKKYLGGGK